MTTEFNKELRRWLVVDNVSEEVRDKILDSKDRIGLNNVLQQEALSQGRIIELSRWLVVDGSDENYLYNVAENVLPRLEEQEDV